MKHIRKILMAAVAALALVPAVKAQSTFGTVFGTSAIVSASTGALASATTNQVIPIYTFPATAGNVVLDSVRITCLSGTTNVPAPTVAVLSGTTGATPLLSGTTLVSGTGPGYSVSIPALTGTLPILTGTLPKTVSLLVTVSGTCPTYNAQVDVKYYFQNPSGGL